MIWNRYIMKLGETKMLRFIYIENIFGIKKIIIKQYFSFCNPSFSLDYRGLFYSFWIITPPLIHAYNIINQTKSVDQWLRIVQ